MSGTTKCDGNCSSCSKDCSSKPQKAPLNEGSKVKKVIAVVSGKGGVGKSLTTAMLATLMQRKGYKTAVLDADITGPSIPKMFGISGRAEADQNGIIPAKTGAGIPPPRRRYRSLNRPSPCYQTSRSPPDTKSAPHHRPGYATGMPGDDHSAITPFHPKSYAP